MTRVVSVAGGSARRGEPAGRDEFNLAARVERMRAANPTWSDRQLRCCLYWQSTAKKIWRVGIKELLWSHPGYSAVACPEAMGVNITETIRLAGVELEWPPVKVTRQVALCGVKLQGKDELHG